MPDRESVADLDEPGFGAGRNLAGELYSVTHRPNLYKILSRQQAGLSN